MLELITGVIVATAVVGLVLEPLIRPRVAAPDLPETDFVELEEADSPKLKALLALREIEFDRATGKLSDDDYQELKAKYGRMALEALDEADEEPTTSDIAELAVARARSRDMVDCSQCGRRPEPGAIFCSHCGRSLAIEDAAPRCWMCGCDLASDAHHCNACGFSLSA